MRVVTFKGIPGHPEYQVGDDGTVMRHKWEEVWTPLRPIRTSQGYCVVVLAHRGKQLRIHRLVLEAFVGPAPSDAHHACHNNGVRFDNRLANLRWDTPSGNEGDKPAHGTHLRGERNHQHRLTVEQVRAVRSMIRGGLSNREIAPHFGVSGTAIRHIRLGRNWKHIV